MTQVVRGGLDFMVNFKVDIKRDYSTHGVESLQMDSGRGNMGQEWSGVVSAKVLREYMTLQGRLHTSQLKS